MNIKPLLLVPLLGVLSALLHAGSRTSVSYSIFADTADAGGKHTTSVAYFNEGSAGGITGISVVASPAESTKQGYIAQLFDVRGLLVNAGASSVNETATLQLTASQFLDDASFLAVSAGAVSWGVVSGPVTGVSATGLATAGTVPQNTAATVQGSFGGFTGSLNLTVLDTIPDNFGSYAGDGLPDDWQVQYFGQPPNANAAPNADPSGNGQNNLFKYIAGLNPLDPNARFLLAIAPVPDPAHPGQFLPGQSNVIFSPRFSDRTYIVKYRTDLATGTWLTLSGTTQNDSVTQRTVTDLNASNPQKFYRIEITKP